jgi:hypothetical protein
MSNTFQNALYSRATDGQTGFYSLSSANGTFVTLNNGAFGDYSVNAIGYDLSDVTIGTGVVALSGNKPITITVNKFENGVSTGDDATTLTIAVSANTPITFGLILGTSALRSTIYVPFDFVSSNGNRTYSVDLSAASTFFTDPENRRLRVLEYI